MLDSARAEASPDEPGAQESGLLERAGRYRLLSELFAAEPDDELLAVAATVPELARHATLAASRRYTHVLVLNAYPFASVYLDPGGGIGGERAGFVRDVLETLGLRVDDGVAADHVAVSFAALTALLEREARGAEPVATERARHAQRTLLAEHLLPWAPHFLDAVERVDHALFGAAAAFARRLLVGHARSLFPAGEPLADASRDAAGRAGGGAATSGGQAVPRAAAHRGDRPATAGRAGSDLLTELASPARCGFFLSRADITAIAAGVGLAVRFGGRRFMLESVAQAAAQRGDGDALRAALTRFAADRRAVLDGWAAALPALAPLWRDARASLDAAVAGWLPGRTAGAATP